MNHIFKGNSYLNGQVKISDSLITLNTAQSTNDCGLIMFKNINDITDITSSGNIVSAGSNTVSITDTFGIGWVVEVNAQRRRVTSVSGTGPTVAILDSAWTTIPNPGDAYNLYSKTQAVMVYKNNQFIFGHTPDIGTGDIVTVTPAPIVVASVSETFTESVVYVSNSGSDANTGLHISQAKLTFTAAATLGKPIVCFDSGTYAEIVTANDIWAPNATITDINSSGKVTVGVCGTFTGSGTLSAVQIGTCVASGILNVTADNISVLNVSNVCMANCKMISDVVCSGTARIISGIGNINVTGIVYALGSQITGTITGSGTCYYADTVRIQNHIENMNNPHNVTINQVSPLNAKGDLLGFNSSNVRVPVGNDGYVLSADSTNTAGLRWIPNGSVTRSANFYLADNIVGDSVAFRSVASFVWKQSEYVGLIDGKLIFYTDSAMDLILSDGVTTYLAGTYTGYQAVPIASPVADAVLNLLVRGQGNLRGVYLRFGTTSESVSNNVTEISANYAVLTTDDHIFCDTTTGPIALTLPGPFNKKYVVVDKGNAGTNAITIPCLGKTNINTNYGSITVISNGTNWYGI